MPTLLFSAFTWLPAVAATALRRNLIFIAPPWPWPAVQGLCRRR